MWRAVIWLAISPPNNLCWNESFGDWDNSRLSLCVIVISRHGKLQRDLGHSQLWIWKAFQWVNPCPFQTHTIDILCWFPNDFLSCWYRYRFRASPPPEWLGTTDAWWLIGGTIFWQHCVLVSSPRTSSRIPAHLHGCSEWLLIIGEGKCDGA